MTRSASTPRIRLLQSCYLLLLAAVAVVDPWAGHFKLGQLLELTGLALIVLATLGRIWASLFIAGRKDALVVDTGPYARCRHPLYAWSTLASLGIGLGTQSVVLTALIVTVSVFVHVTAALSEERRLIADLGTDYRNYAARVPRFWPHAKAAVPVSAVTVDAAIFRKAFLDGASIFGLYIAMQLIAAARDAGWWRTFANVY